MLRKLIREIVEEIVLKESAAEFAADLISREDIDFITQTIANSKGSLMSAIAEQLHVLKGKNPEKYTAISNSLIQMLQSGIKERLIVNFFAIFYLQTGMSFKNSVINVLKNTYKNISSDLIEEKLADHLIALLPIYKSVPGSNFDSFLYRSTYNAISKIINKNNNNGTEEIDDEMATGDITDFQADKEVVQQKLNDKLANVNAGVQELGAVLQKLAKEKPHKWQKVLNAFSDVYVDGKSWIDLLAKTSNWKRYDSIGTGKRNLVQFLIIPALESLQEVRSGVDRSQGVWSIFELGPNGIVLGVKDAARFKMLKSRLQEPLQKVMDYIADDSIDLDLKTLNLDKKGLDNVISFLRSNLTLPIKNTAKLYNIDFDQTAHKSLIVKRKLSKI